MPEQTYSNHTRWYPLFHFWVMPIVLLNFLVQLVRMLTNTGDARFEQIGWSVLGLSLMLLAFAARLMVLTVQDRLIRLEERLRYAGVLKPELHTRAGELT